MLLRERERFISALEYSRLSKILIFSSFSSLAHEHTDRDGRWYKERCISREIFLLRLVGNNDNKIHSAYSKRAVSAYRMPIRHKEHHAAPQNIYFIRKWKYFCGQQAVYWCNSHSLSVSYIVPFIILLTIRLVVIHPENESLYSQSY